MELSNGKEIVTDNSWNWFNDVLIIFADLQDTEIIGFNKVPKSKGKVRLGKYVKEITSSNYSHVIDISS